tara:strand:- start:73247 stop:76888 length:3642 start_codon:yes stop_codon:yes gene_type:complete
MKTFLPKSGLLTLVFLITNLFFASGAFAQATIENAPAGAVTGTTTIETDKQDYPPGGEVIISGRGYLPNEKVWLQIVHEGEDPNGIDEPNHQPFLVQADGGGVIEGVIWIVPTNGDSLGATFILSATSSVRGDGSFTYAGWKFTDKDNTSVSLTSSTNPSSLGTTVTFTATVNGTSAGGVPAGSIDFKDGNTVLASNVAFSSTTSNKSTATFTTSTLVVGTHIITAKYGAIGSVYNSSTSTELNQVVTSPCTSPIIYTVTGGGAYCSGGAGLAVGLSNSETGVSYHLYKDAIITGSAVLGTSGSSISFGTQTVVGTYTVVATRVDGSCTSNMTGNAIISTNPLPSAPGANNYNAPYDGTSHSATATAPSGSTVVYYDASSAGNVISAPTGTNAGPTITAYAESVSASGCKSTSRTPVTLAITKRSLEITASSDTKVYDGTALTNLGFTITGSGTLASGQTLSAVTVIGSQTAFGSSNNVASAAVIKNAALVDVTSNYDVSYVNGTLAITKRSLNFTGTRAFDGSVTFAAANLIAGNIVNGDPVSIGGSATVSSSNQGFYTSFVTNNLTSSNTNYKVIGGTVNVTITPASTSVTVASVSVQYSDQVTLIATVTSSTGQAELNATGGTVAFKIQLNSNPIITLGSASFTSGNTVSKDFIITQAPGTYKVIAVFTPNSSNLSGITNDNTGPLTVTQEDARVYYTGSTFVSTSSSTSNTATVVLNATVRDVTAESGDPLYDAYAGDIRYAKVRFVNRDAGDAPISDWLSVGLVNLADLKTGTVSYVWNSASTGSGDSEQYTIGMIVDNGYYIRNNSDDNTVITVSKPLNDFITGGGYMILKNSNGQLAGDAGRKNNFGFNVKYNKSGKNLQGNINSIFRRTEADGKLHVYQIKGNAMSSLSLIVESSTTGPAKAVFDGKCNIKDITYTNSASPEYIKMYVTDGYPTSVDGGALLHVTMTDMGEPGKYDSIGITVTSSKGGVWFSSNWNGIQSAEQIIDGGNLQVHGSSSSIGTIPTALGFVMQSPVTSPVNYGTEITFKATITESNSANPSGYVYFYDGANYLSKGVVSTTSGVTSVTLKIANLVAGSHDIIAYYSGDSKFATSTNSLALTVNASTARSSSVVTAKKIILAPVGLELVPFNVIAYPNPSNNQFTLAIEGGSNEKVEVKVFDLLGRLVKVINKNDAQPTLFGEDLPAGSYITVINQGIETKTVRLIKK